MYVICSIYISYHVVSHQSNISTSILSLFVSSPSGKKSWKFQIKNFRMILEKICIPANFGQRSIFYNSKESWNTFNWQMKLFFRYSLKKLEKSLFQKIIPCVIVGQNFLVLVHQQELRILLIGDCQKEECWSASGPLICPQKIFLKCQVADLFYFPFFPFSIYIRSYKWN